MPNLEDYNIYDMFVDIVAMDWRDLGKGFCYFCSELSRYYQVDGYELNLL